MTVNTPTGKESFEEIKRIIDGLQEDVNKFYVKEINAAGSRIGRGLRQIGDIVRAEKKNVIELRKSRKK
jgi:DNA-binding PadR family transcriptional regulator